MNPSGLIPVLFFLFRCPKVRFVAVQRVSSLTYTLENGVLATNLGGFGPAITYAGGIGFLALPDRGPNAVPFNPAVGQHGGLCEPFHTVHLNLTPNRTLDCRLS